MRSITIGKPPDDQIVGEPQGAIALTTQPCVSLSVSLSVPQNCVLAFVRSAVSFNDDLSFEANKVGEARSDRRLPAKLVAFESMITQRAPKRGFRPCRAATLSTRELARRLRPIVRLLHVQHITQTAV